jgi:hypothetical protein
MDVVAGRELHPKADGAAHIADNAAAMDLSLSPAELAAIDTAFPAGSTRGDLPMI